MKGEVCILCCENIKAEVCKALEAPDLEDVEVIVFERHTGRSEDDRLNEVEAFNRSGKRCRLLLVLGCGCMYKVMIPQPDEVESIHLGSGPDLFLPPKLVEHETSLGSFMVTPGWLMDWKDHLQETCGSLEGMIRDTIKTIILLDTGTVPDIDDQLVAFADHIGLPYHKLPVGVDNLRLLIQSKLCDWRCKLKDNLLHEAEIAKRRAADYAMVFDLIGEVTGLRVESDLVDNVLRIYQLLFSPSELSYIKFDSGEWSGSSAGRIPEHYSERIRVPIEGCPIHPDGNGFMQMVTYKDETMGAIIVDGISFPNFIQEYITTSTFITSILGLAIFNARIYGKLNSAIDELESEVSERLAAERKLENANHKLNLLGKITRHDTLNQVTVIKGYLDLMCDSLNEERYQKYMKRMDTAVSCMVELIEFAREYERIGMEMAEWIPMEEAFAGLDFTDIKFDDCCPGLMVYADKLLDKVFYNLLDNTRRHSGGATTVRLSAEPSEEGLLLRWEDDGQGVPEDQKERIFERGVGKNTGYGLFIIREILNITGIRIVEDGVPGQGARFTMTIPAGQYRFRT